MMIHCGYREDKRSTLLMPYQQLPPCPMRGLYARRGLLEGPRGHVSQFVASCFLVTYRIHAVNLQLEIQPKEWSHHKERSRSQVGGQGYSSMQPAGTCLHVSGCEVRPLVMHCWPPAAYLPMSPM